MTTRLAFIGGSGVYSIEEMQKTDEITLETPFGKTSDSIKIGTFNGRDHIAFLARHGSGHRLLPTEVPSRANIWALKKLGVEYIVSISAVGSLREEIAPQHIVIPDQILDRTRYRPESTFFGGGIAGHVSFAEPFCAELRGALLEAVRDAGGTAHDGGTLLCVEGPMFSSRAESALYRSWGLSILGMTSIPEARLAREAEIGYATMALVTDYDSWRESSEAVTANLVMENMRANTALAHRLVEWLARHPDALPKTCACQSAAQAAIMTAADGIPIEAKEKLSLFYGKYWSQP